MKFISNEEWKELNKQPDEMLINEILSRVCNMAVENAIRKLPEVVSRLMATTAATKALTQRFFEDNKDFEKHKDIVTAVVQDVESLHPDWDYAAILKEAEDKIQQKIIAGNNVPELAMDIPKDINLDGNGVI